jgi:hypothetical protein
VLLECGQARRRCNLPLPPQPRSVVVERVDDGDEQEARPVVVELDELAAALGWKMKILGTQEANLRSSQLRNRRRLAQGRRLPGDATGDAVEGANEFGNLGEDWAGIIRCCGTTENSCGIPAARSAL